jgi:hypothetical protein
MRPPQLWTRTRSGRSTIPAVDTEPIKPHRSRYRMTRRRSASIVPPTVEPSLLTPAGIIQGYGSAFRSMRGSTRRRRIAATVFAVLIFVPSLVVIIGFGMVIAHSI